MDEFEQPMYPSSKIDMNGVCDKVNTRNDNGIFYANTRWQSLPSVNYYEDTLPKNTDSGPEFVFHGGNTTPGCTNFPKDQRRDVRKFPSINLKK